MSKTINVLGAEYTIEIGHATDDVLLKKYDGYCDKTSHKIIIAGETDDCELDIFVEYQNKLMRHEIIHAFLYESGLHENFKHDEYGHDETIIDWFAVQFPKILKAFQEAECI
jgi:hypothetical protein